MNTDNTEPSKKPSYLDHRKRLRKRFSELGIESLYDYEVVELLLTFSIPYKDVKPVAKELLEKYGSLKAIFDSPPEELKKFQYVKEKTIDLIRFIKEISALYQKQKASELPVTSNMKEIIQYCIKKIGWKEDEEFHVIYLDGKYNVLDNRDFTREFISKGTTDRASVYPRKILEQALKNKAHALILSHNHTNGNIQPSEQDINLTKAISLSAKTLGIFLYDHVIVSGDKYFSFRENQLL